MPAIYRGSGSRDKMRCCCAEVYEAEGIDKVHLGRDCEREHVLEAHEPLNI